MFFDHLVKLELLPRLGLKKSMLTSGVTILLGFRRFLSTCALLHANTVTIFFDLIVLSGDKLFRGSSTQKLSQTFVTRSCLMTMMTAGSKRIGLTDNFPNFVDNVSLFLWIATWINLFVGITYCVYLRVRLIIYKIVYCWYIFLLYRRLKWSIACDFVDVTFELCFRFSHYFTKCLSDLIIGQWCTFAIIVFD